MGREKENYRENIEQLNRLFPECEMLTMKDVMRVLGYTDPRPIKQYLGSRFVNGKLSKAALARYMCG